MYYYYTVNFKLCFTLKNQPSSLSLHYIRKTCEVLKLIFFKTLEKALHLLLLLLRVTALFLASVFQNSMAPLEEPWI